MSSRKEEKERLRREREDAERAATASERRRKRIAAVLGGVLLAAVAVVVVLAVVSGDDEGSNQTQGGNQAIPAKQISDVDEAAKAAGCKVSDHPDEGQGHSTADATYETNPPTSGTHDPQAAEDGVYPDPPDVEQSVHALEHGRVNIQYRAGTPQNRINQLETLFNEDVLGEPGHHTLLFENQTEMPHAVAATGWTHSLTCPQFNDKVFDAVRAFRQEMVAGKWVTDIPEQVE